MSSRKSLDYVTYEPVEGTITAVFTQEFFVGRGKDDEPVYEKGNEYDIERVFFQPKKLVISINGVVENTFKSSSHVFREFERELDSKESTDILDNGIKQKLDEDKWFLFDTVEYISGGVLKDLQPSAHFDIEIQVSDDETWKITYQR